MTDRERILAACGGQKTDRVPWIPRLDLWYNAHSWAGTLPPPYRGLSLREITDAMGVGFHAVVPDFAGQRTPKDTADRGLGIFRLTGMTYDTILHGVDRQLEVEGDTTRVTYITPVGSVSCCFSYTPDMRRAGASISWMNEHVIKGPDDLPVLEHIFSHLKVVPTYDEYRGWNHWVGEAGVAVAYGNAAASPMQHIMRDLMPMTDFFLALHDYPAQVRSLADSMESWFEQVLAALVASPAEIIFWGGNYDEQITYPPFFEAHILPWLARASHTAHRHGKLLLTHTDGENQLLLDLYRRAGFDIADSLCPAPMTKMTLTEAAAALPGVVIWGGIPSVALLPELVSDADFEHLVEEALVLAGERGRLILGISDTTPANAPLDRLLRITELVGAQ